MTNKHKIMENMTNQQIHFSNNSIDRSRYTPIGLQKTLENKLEKYKYRETTF